MSITDELREYAEELDRMAAMKSEHGMSPVALRLRHHADRIDDALLSERNAAYNKGYDEGFASADDWLADHEDAMAEHGWVRLPVDADGVPIHVGDELEPTGECGMRVTVNSIQLTNDGCWVFAGAMGRRPHKYRHVKPDSWEQIIEDARRMDGCGSLGEFMERHGAALVARCKALAGDAE